MPFPICTHRAFLVALTVSLTACGPQQPHGGHGGFGMHHGVGLAMRAARLGMRGARPVGFRRACADDAARLCPQAGRPRAERECLEGKLTSLSAECRDALARRRREQ